MIMMMNHWMVWGSLFVWKQHIALDTLGWRCVGCKAKWQDIIMGRFSTGGTCFSNNWRNSRWIKWLTDIKSCFLKGKGTQAPWARGINSRFSWAFFNCPIFSNIFPYVCLQNPSVSHIFPYSPVVSLRFSPAVSPFHRKAWRGTWIRRAPSLRSCGSCCRSKASTSNWWRLEVPAVLRCFKNGWWMLMISNKSWWCCIYIYTVINACKLLHVCHYDFCWWL